MTRILTNSDDTTDSGGLGRRTLLKGAATVAASALLASRANARDFGANAEPQRYPDPDIVVIDPKRFKAKVGNTSIKRLYTGCLWAEGPAWNSQGQYLVWSDIPANRQLRYLDDDGHISEQFHKPSNEANGNSFDTEARDRNRRRKPSISGTARKRANCACSAATPARMSISHHARSARPAPRARSASSRRAARVSSTAT